MKNTSDTQPFRETYIVRLWHEGNAQANWNGQIQHISSGETTVIRNIEDLLEYFRTQLETYPDKEPLSSKLK